MAVSTLLSQLYPGLVNQVFNSAALPGAQPKMSPLSGGMEGQVSIGRMPSMIDGGDMMGAGAQAGTPPTGVPPLPQIGQPGQSSQPGIGLMPGTGGMGDPMGGGMSNSLSALFGRQFQQPASFLPGPWNTGMGGFGGGQSPWSPAMLAGLLQQFMPRPPAAALPPAIPVPLDPNIFPGGGGPGWRPGPEQGMN